MRSFTICLATALVVAAASAAVLPDQLVQAKGITTIAADKADKEWGHDHHRGNMTKEQFEAYRLKRLQEMAVYFGISTEGKTAAQLKQELVAAKEANKEKWEAFKAEHQAKRLEHLREIAERHGIKTDSKTEEQLREELMKVHGGKGKHRWKEKHGHMHEQERGTEPQKQP